MNIDDLMKDDYYRILGITQLASDEEITKAYRNKAKEVHPDKFEIGSIEYNEAEKNFKKLQLIKETLLDRLKRYEYDQKLLEEQQVYISYIATNFNIQSKKEDVKETKKSFKDILREKMEDKVLKPEDSFTFSNEALNYNKNNTYEDELTKEEKALKYKKDGARRLYDLGYKAMRYGDHQRARTYFKSAKYLDPGLKIPYQYYT